MKRNHVFIRQVPEIIQPIKIGAWANPGWAGYWRRGRILIKKFEACSGEYPDYGCSAEVYANGKMLELETLGPLKEVMPGDCAEHTETWKVCRTGALEPEAGDIGEKIAELTG